MFDWDDLKVFLAVARSRRISPAARALGVEATTVSRRLARLSSTIGVELFETSGGERSLTEQGRALMRHAEQVESAALAAAEDMTGTPGGLSGHVRLSVAEGFGTWVLAPDLAAFHVDNPGIRLDIVTASGFLNPSKREADMAVMLGRPQRGRLTVKRLGDYRLHLYATSDYLAKAGVPTTRGALKDHRLIGYIPDLIFSPELDYLDDIEPGLEPHLRSTSINVQYRMIASGAGIGVLPAFIGRTDARLVPILEHDVELIRSFWLVTHSDLTSLARIGAVQNWLQRRAALHS